MTEPSQTFTPTLTLHVTGMDCADCARTVENGVGQLAGVDACRVNFATQRLQVMGAVQPAEIEAQVRRLGYEIAAPETTPPVDDQTFLTFLWRSPKTRLAVLAVLLILPGLILTEILGVEHALINLASIGALLLAGGPVARNGWQNLRINRTLNINALMTIAAVGAVIIGAYVEAGMVMTLFAVGEALEGYTAERARNAIRSFTELTPKTALKLDGSGRQSPVPVDELTSGDHILVRPGERIAMDGIVRDGASAVNQAPITGESIPIDVESGAPVFAGTINGFGALEIEVTGNAADNTLSRIVQLVQEAQEAQAPTQRLVDRFAAVYTPAVVLLAVLVAIIPPLLFGRPFLNPADGSFGWLYRALALLVVACPCALVISTPVTVISAIANAARRGVLIKGGAILERMPAIRTVAFDKTGTITAGAPAVVAVRAAACPTPDGHLLSASCAPCDDLLALAGTLEEKSEHPLARAVVNEAARRGLQTRYGAARDVHALGGRGLRGDVTTEESMHQVLIGSHAYFHAGPIEHDQLHCKLAHADAEAGRTTMLISRDGVYAGTIALADTVRATTGDALQALRAEGIERVVLLTGDQEVTARAIADSLDFDAIKADLLPQDKIAEVERLKANSPVAMVGDGINDAPALAAADVGIALGGAGLGTAQAMETADITVMSDDLGKVPQIFRLARATVAKLRTNIALSIGIKLIFMALVIGGMGTMWMAVLADVGTSLLVTLNGMRLLRWNG